ncbi:MAG TPA: hypothetical protein VE242_09885 [Chthoniobacterales bacterium]|nr:hypothetical protein [Chthoniobacterales bacterium]
MFRVISKLLAYRKGLRTVQEITGLDSREAHRLYLAFVTRNWSKTPTAHLRILRQPIDRTDHEMVRRVLNDWSNPNLSLERQLMADIFIERSRREALQEWERARKEIIKEDRGKDNQS